MSNSASLTPVNKIHINSSTKMTLSDRFTAFSAKPKINPRTSRRGIESPVSRAASIANRRLLKQLAQKHTRDTALKLKRRSMKARPQYIQTAAFKRVSNGVPLKRGTVKALRLGPSGRLLKANSISNVATMEADLLGQRRRTNSVSRITERIGGNRFQGVRRTNARPVWGLKSQSNSVRQMLPKARMRSRSRPRVQPSSRLLQSGVVSRLARGRSNSRPRQIFRSRSRSRVNGLTRMDDVRGMNSVPVTSRLGRRPGPLRVRARSSSRSRAGVVGRLMRGGVATGRIQRRRNSVTASTARGASLAAGGAENRLSRPKGRLGSQKTALVAANQRFPTVDLTRRSSSRGRVRSRSRTDNRSLQRSNSRGRRGGPANRQRGGMQRGRSAIRGTGRRGRSQQRGGQQRNGNDLQQRRGRSRSRGRGSARGGRQQGTDKPEVKKEELDKELDQYMSSTKTSDGLFS